MEKKLKQNTMARINDLVMQFHYDAFKLLALNKAVRDQLLGHIKRGTAWVIEGLEDDSKEIAKRAKPKLNRRPIKKSKDKLGSKPIKLSDYVGDKQVGIFRKRKK